MAKFRVKKQQSGLKPLNLSQNRLPVQYSVIVPSTKNVPNSKGRLVSKDVSPSVYSSRIKDTRSEVTKMFGGYTSVRSLGGYRQEIKDKEGNIIKDGNGNPKTELVVEPSMIVEGSTTPAKFNANRNNMESFLKKRQTKWKQDTVYYTVEGETFIYPKQGYISNWKTNRNIKVT